MSTRQTWGRIFSENFKERTYLSYIVILRVFIGYKFLVAGINKLSGGYLAMPIVAGILTKWADGNPNLWYKSFLLDFAIPNSNLLTYLIVFGELLVGMALLLGLMTRIAALSGIFMNLNFLLASGWQSGASAGINQAFIACQLVIFLSGAGRSFGIDRLLRKKK